MINFTFLRNFYILAERCSTFSGSGLPDALVRRGGRGVPKNNEKVEVLRMGFAVVVAAVVVEPRRFGRGNWCLHFPKALVRNESRRTASPKKELGWERGSKSSRKIVEKKSSQNGILYSGKA